MSVHEHVRLGDCVRSRNGWHPCAHRRLAHAMRLSPRAHAMRLSLQAHALWLGLQAHAMKLSLQAHAMWHSPRGPHPCWVGESVRFACASWRCRGRA